MFATLESKPSNLSPTFFTQNFTSGVKMVDQAACQYWTATWYRNDAYPSILRQGLALDHKDRIEMCLELGGIGKSKTDLSTPSMPYIP